MVEQSYNQHARPLPEITVGTRVAIQDQCTKWWDIYGTVTEAGECLSETDDSYGNESPSPQSHVRTDPVQANLLLKLPHLDHCQHLFLGDHPVLEHQQNA